MYLSIPVTVESENVNRWIWNYQSPFFLWSLLSVKVWWLLLYFSDSCSMRRIALIQAFSPYFIALPSGLSSMAYSIRNLWASHSDCDLHYVPRFVCFLLLAFAPDTNTFPSSAICFFKSFFFLSRKGIGLSLNLFHIS